MPASAEHSLSDARLRALFQNSQTGMVIINQEHRVVDANQAFARMLGYTCEEIIELHTWDWEAALSEEDIRHQFADLASTQKRFETKHRRKDGSLCDVEVSASGISFGDENCVICICTDISERKESQERLLRMSQQDPLTKLPNRAAYEKHLQKISQAPASHHPVSFLSCDLDDLKKVNDQAGHLQGDKMLQACAHILRQEVSSHQLAARLGGDEFVIVLSQTGQRQAKSLRRKIHRKIMAYNRAHHPKIYLSIGVATASEPNMPLEKLFHQADSDMLRFKRLAKRFRAKKSCD